MFEHSAVKKVKIRISTVGQRKEKEKKVARIANICLCMPRYAISPVSVATSMYTDTVQGCPISMI